MAQLGTNVEEDLQLLEIRIKQAQQEYEQYFLGSRKREPQRTRLAAQKIIQYYTNVPIKNTGLRFKFNTLRSRFFAYRRKWDHTLRKIEEGRYERDLFKARLRERERNEARERARDAAERRGEPGETRGDALYRSYLDARQACGQGADGLSRERLEKVLAQQERQIRAKYGCEKVRFRVVVEGGKAKLKAQPVRR